MTTPSATNSPRARARILFYLNHIMKQSSPHCPRCPHKFLLAHHPWRYTPLPGVPCWDEKGGGMTPLSPTVSVTISVESLNAILMQSHQIAFHLEILAGMTEPAARATLLSTLLPSMQQGCVKIQRTLCTAVGMEGGVA